MPMPSDPAVPRPAPRDFEADLAEMQRLAESDPADARLQHALSEAWLSVGHVRRARNDVHGAHEAYEAALDILRRLTAGHPSNRAWQSDLLTVWVFLGRMREACGDLSGAE